MASFKPTSGMKTEAKKGLDWRKEHGRGGTRIGIARARDIVNNKELPLRTVKRMYSFFARHEVDKKAQGFRPGEDGFPSNGRIAWALWGGDAGFRWSKRIVESEKKKQEKAHDILKNTNINYNSAMDEIRHIKNIQETDEEVLVTFAKLSEETSEEHLEEERPGDHDNEERKDKDKEKSYHDDEKSAHTDEEKDGHLDEEKDGHLDEEKDGHLEEEEEEEKRSDHFKVGDFVSWDSSGGRARGKIEKIERDGKIKIPGSTVSITGTEDDPAALIQLYRSGEPQEQRVVHKFSTLRKIDPIRSANVTYYISRQLNKDLIDEDSRTVRIALTSETPVERNFGKEILSHEKDDIDMEFMASGRAPLLLDHNPERQIGVIEKFSLDRNTRRTLAHVRFGKSDLAREIFTDIQDGIRQNVSVGYQVNKMRKDPETKDAYRVSWSPMEASIVSIPADQSSGVGVARNAENNNKTQKEVNKMSEDNKLENEEIRSKVYAEAKSSVSKEIDEILELGSQHGKTELARKAIKDGVSVNDFRSSLLDSIRSEPIESPDIGLTAKETKQFSIMRAVRAMSNPSSRKLREEAAFEFDASEAAKIKFGRNSEGLTLPSEVMSNWSVRDVNTSDDAGGVGQAFLPERFIDALRASSAVLQAGATVLEGLTDNVKIPKQTGIATAAFISAEGGAASESELTLGSITMAPKTASVFTEVTNLMMQQSSLDIERLIRNDLAAGISKLVDTGSLAGSGSSGNPTGIDNTTGLNTVNYTDNDPTFAEVVSMESSILNDNVILNNPVYLTTSAIAGAMKVKAKDSGSGLFVNEGNRVNGYPVLVSNNVASGVMYFGNFADLLIGFFGGLDLLVDPYTNSANSVTRLRATQFLDVAVRHGQSFCKGE